MHTLMLHLPYLVFFHFLFPCQHMASSRPDSDLHADHPTKMLIALESHAMSSEYSNRVFIHKHHIFKYTTIMTII